MGEFITGTGVGTSVGGNFAVGRRLYSAVGVGVEEAVIKTFVGLAGMAVAGVQLTTTIPKLINIHNRPVIFGQGFICLFPRFSGSVAQNGLDLVQFVVAESQVLQGRQVVFQLFDAARSDQCRGDLRFAQHPGQCQL